VSGFVGSKVLKTVGRAIQSVVKNHSNFEKTPMHGQTGLPDWISQKVVRNAKQILILKVLPPAASKKSAVCCLFFVRLHFAFLPSFKSFKLFKPSDYMNPDISVLLLVCFLF
jgi:hypothetical protein